MALTPFNGELDVPAPGLKPFDGKLDGEKEGFLDSLKGAGASAVGAIGSAGNYAADAGMGLLNRFGSGSGLTAQSVGRTIAAPAATALEMVAGLGAAVSDEDHKPGRQEFARSVSDYADWQRKENLANGNAFADLGAKSEELGKSAQDYYDKSFSEVAPGAKKELQNVQQAEGFVGNLKAMATNPAGTAAMVAQSLPDMAVAAAGGALIGRGAAANSFTKASAELAANNAGKAAAADALAKGATADAAQSAGKTAAESTYRGAIQGAAEKAGEVTGPAIEAVQSGMQNRIQTEQFVMDKNQVSDAALYKHNETFRKLVDSGMPSDEARASIARELGNESGALGSIFTYGGSQLAGGAGALGAVAAGRKASGVQTLKNIGKEALEEGLQNPGENWAQYKAQQQVDPNQKYDFGGSVAQGLVTGGLMGSGPHGAAYIGSKFGQDGNAEIQDTPPGAPPAQAPLPDTGPMSRSANVAMATGAADQAAAAQAADVLGAPPSENNDTLNNQPAETSPVAPNVGPLDTAAAAADPVAAARAAEQAAGAAPSTAETPTRRGRDEKFGVDVELSKGKDGYVLSETDWNGVKSEKKISTGYGGVYFGDQVLNQEGEFVPAKNIIQAGNSTSESAPFRGTTAEREAVVALVADIAFARATGDTKTADELDNKLFDIASGKVSSISPSNGPAAAPKGNGAANLDMQNRDRTRAASVMQMQKIAQNPDYELASIARDSNGAPMVGNNGAVAPAAVGKKERVTLPDGTKINTNYAVVEADSLSPSHFADGTVNAGYGNDGKLTALNNGRTAGLMQAYSIGTAGNYRAALEEDTDGHGIPREVIAGMKAPVLVRLYDPASVDQTNLGARSNQASALGLGTSEQASSDAAMIDSMDGLNPDESGDFSTSRDFIRRFMARLPQTEQGGMVEANGELSQAGYARVRNAILAKAYGDSPVLRSMTESLDDNMRNVTKALIKVAPQVAKARSAIADGALFDADITPDLLAAVSELSQLKSSGRSINDALAQEALFGGYSDEVKSILQFIGDNLRRPNKIAEFISRTFDALAAAGSPNQGSMFGESKAPTKGELLNAAKRETNGQEASGQLFGNEEAGGQAGTKLSRAPGNAQGNAADAAKAQGEWVAFPPESKTLGIPRADMPQIKGDHRGALIQFLDGRDIQHKTIEVAADQLHPTQAEFSTEKAAKWGEVRDGVDRSVLISSDGYILDGHHQWIAALATKEPVKAIVFSAPIDKLLAEVFQFPSVKQSDGAKADAGRVQARQDFDVALADLGSIIRQINPGVRMLTPEEKIQLMPTLVKLFESGIKTVGYNIKDLIADVRKAMKESADEFVRKHWNKIDEKTYKEAAAKAVENVLASKVNEQGQQDLFAAPAAKPAAPVGETMDLFSAISAVAPSLNSIADNASSGQIGGKSTPSTAATTTKGAENGQGQKTEVLNKAGAASSSVAPAESETGAAVVARPARTANAVSEIRMSAGMAIGSADIADETLLPQPAVAAAPPNRPPENENATKAEAGIPPIPPKVVTEGGKPVPTKKLGKRATEALAIMQEGGYWRKALETSFIGGEKFQTRLRYANGGIAPGVGFKTFTEMQDAGLLQRRDVPKSTVYAQEWGLRDKPLVKQGAQSPKPSAGNELEVAHRIMREWGALLGPDVEITLGGSLVSGLWVQKGNEPVDLDIRFLVGEPSREIADKIAKATGLAFRKSIPVNDHPTGMSTAFMVEGEITVDGINFDVEGSVRNKAYVGWAKYYPEYLTTKELEQFRADKARLKGDKPAYKALKAGVLEEVQRRVIADRRLVVIDGITYDADAKNFGFPPPAMALKEGSPLLVETYTLPDDSLVSYAGAMVSRAEMRNEIENDAFVTAVPAPPGRKPIAYVMGGGGASGKGVIKTYLQNEGVILASDAVSIDPDEIKTQIPEYNLITSAGDSRGAAVVHEESSSLAKRIKARAISGRYNMVLDVTLGNKEKALSYIEELKNSGYEVRLFGVTVAPETAVVRSLIRAKNTNRLVPIKELLLAHKGFLSAFESYAEAADEFRLYDTSDGIKNIAEKAGGSLEVNDAAAYNDIEERSKINELATTIREIGESRKGDAENSRAARSDAGGNAASNGPGGPNEGGQGGNIAGADRQGSEGEIRRGGLNVDGQNDTPGAEGQEPGAVQGTIGDGKTDGVRNGPGRANGRPNRNADAGNSGAERGEQGGIVPGKGGDSQPGAQPGDRNGAGRNAGIPAGRDIPAKSGRNYAFGDGDLTYTGSWQTKARQNVEAVELLKKLQAENRQATREEQAVLAKFIGWGASELANNLFGAKLDEQAKALSDYEKAIENLGSKEYLTNSNYQAYQPAFAVLKAKNDALNWYTTGNITKAMLDAAKPDASVKKWVEMRDRLKAVMTPEEWAEASRSTQYAHYTSKPVVNSMLSAIERMGFKGGTILEPGAGIGVFAGLMNPAMATNSVYTGIEFDSITGGILKQLFPDERILVESFIDSKIPENYYDVAFGNPPFAGRVKVLGDPKYAKLALKLHDYFFAKSIDSVKPGGLVIFISSRFTMDKKDDKARAYMAERADLVGAIRLPQTAFQKNAGTEVVTDVLFLRKKVPGETFSGAQPWAGLAPVKTEKGDVDVNEYFAAHPEMVLGTHSRKGSMYGKDEYTVLPNEGDIEAQFDAAAKRMPENIFVPGRSSAAEAARVREMDFNPKAKKEGGFYVTDAGVLMQREGGVGVRAENRHQKNAELIKDYIPLRDAVKQAQYDQLNEGDWETSLKALQKAYADFTKKNGPVSKFTTYMQKVKIEEVDEDGIPTGNKVWDEEERRRSPNLAKINDDPDWTLVAALEEIDDETGVITPSKWLTKRTLNKQKKADVRTPSDALLASLNDVGRVDIGNIASRIGLSEQETIDALGTLIYNDPAQGWVMADEYLSGNVVAKLHAAEEAAKNDKNLERNVDALKSVQPPARTFDQITPQIGMNWIPGKVYEDFLYQTAGVKAKIEYVERAKEWALTVESGHQSPRATVDWGVGDKAHAGWLMEKALTGARISLNKAVGDGKGGVKNVFDPVRTEAANEKANELREAFKNWLFTDANRTDELVRTYNDKFNTNVQRKFDGKHLTLPGASALFNIFDHVKRGAWRVIQTGNTYLAHAVGSGKTFEMVISAMEQKRLGLIKKPMMIVPNHMLQQFATEWQQLYPTARLMVADEEGFTGDNRRKFVSRVAMSDLDGVVMTHSSFKLLDLDPVFKQKMIEQELEFMRASYEEAGGDLNDIGNKKVRKDPKIKRIEAQIQALEEQLALAMSSEGKDKNVRFDEMGVDFLYVDEAHLFRKLSYATNRQVKGIDPKGSQMAWDLYMKSRWLAERNPTRFMAMASGTPITNTIAELFTVQRYLAPKTLEEKGLSAFDDWASNFGAESTEIESTSSGKYEPVTRFQQFVNVGEMTQMFRDFADVLTEDQLAVLLGDKRPKVSGGSRKSVITPKTSSYEAFQQDVLIPRIERTKRWKPSFEQKYNPDPLININTDARLAAIDIRFMDPKAPSDPSSKLNLMIDKIIEIYKETSDNAYRVKSTKDDNGNEVLGAFEPLKGAAQMVFYESGFGRGAAASRGFSARAWMEKRLREAGIPTSQVAFMEDYKKSAAKLKLFNEVNKGKVRILVGSSAAMGTGVNAQQRLIAMHHLDAPMVPATLEQREGRIIRQGNKNSEVEIYAFSMKGSFDENQWGMLARKKFFQDQAMSGDPNLRTIEDVGEVSQMQITAGLIAENPYVIQHAGAKAEVEKLQRLFRNHEDQRGRMRNEYEWAARHIESMQRQLVGAEKVAAQAQDLSGEKFVAKSGGKEFTNRKEWAEDILATQKDKSDRLFVGKEKIGEISGFDVFYTGGFAEGAIHSELRDNVLKEWKETGPYFGWVGIDIPSMQTTISPDAQSNPVGMSIRATNAVAEVARLPADLKRQISEQKDKRNALESRLEARFPLAEQLANKIKEVADLEEQMQNYGKAPAAGAPIGLKYNKDEWANATTMFSRGNGAGMAVRDLQATADRVARGFKNLPKVHVLASPAELSTTDQVQAELRAFIQKAGAWEDVEGATHQGEIYLFASGLADEARAEHVLATHEVTHYGLRGAVGKKLDSALQHIWMNNAAVRKQATAIKQRNGLASNVEAVEEVLADMETADLAKLNGWRKLVGAVRDWLNKAGATKLAARLDEWINSGLDDQQKADLFVADLVSAARNFAKNGKPNGGVMMDRTLLADGTLAEDVARQEKWLMREAKARGYASIDELAEKNYPAFEKLASKWREMNPVENALLSRDKQLADEPAINVDGEWTTGEPPKVGEKFIVYRLGNPGDNLAGRNAGNANGVAYHIAMGQNDFKTGNPRGSTIYAYEVVVDKPFGKYDGINRGANGDHPINEGGAVGRTQDKSNVSYSFPRGGAWSAKALGSISIGEVHALMRKDGYENFDDSGTLNGANYIRQALADKLGAAGQEIPRYSRAGNAPTAAERADAIIARPAVNVRPVDAIMRQLSHVTRFDKLTSGLYNKAGYLLDRFTPEQIKAGVISDYGIPEAVTDRRVLMQGAMKQQLRGAGELIDRLSMLTRAESRVAYEWMNNNDPQALKYFEAQLPPESVKVMEEVKALVDEMSKEAIRLGQLSPDAYARNRMEYLRRSYVKHTTELTKADTAGRKRAIAILGDQYKGRGMTDAVDMAKFKNIAPEWWGRKLNEGQADKGMKGEKFIRLERRAPAGEGVATLEQAQGPGETNPQKKGKLLEVSYWPAGEPMPAKYSTWDQAGTWEVRDTKGNNLIVWRDFTKAERETMGEIDEARYAIGKTLHGMIHDVETGRYLEWLAQNYAKKPGETLDGEVIEAKEMNGLANGVFKPGTWVKVPETKVQGTSVMKYGALAGRYLPGPIWNDVRQTVGFRFKPFGEVYAAILSAWKTSKTALSPAVHTNNVMANLVMADWHDVSAGHIVKALRIMLGASDRQGEGAIGRTGNGLARAGMKDQAAAKEIINRFEDSGGSIGTWATSELQKEQLEPLLRALEKEVGIAGQEQVGQIGAMVALQKVLQLRFPSAWAAFKPTMAGKALTTEASNLINLYEAEDQVFRLAAWLKEKEQGASDVEAGKFARRSFLDYHINAPWIQAMRSTALPFVAFTYRAVPMLLETAAKKPHKIMKLALLAGALNALGYLLSGGDEDKERKLLPEEKAGRVWGMVPKMIRMPWNDANGSPVFMDVRRWVPVGDVLDTGQGHSALPVPPSLVPGGPLSVAFELIANRSQFTGKDITKETDTTTEKAAKVADHLYKAFAPNLVVLPGTYAWTGVANANSGKTDAFGREQSVPQAALSAMGVKIGSYPGDVLLLNEQRKMQRGLMEIDGNITGLKREFARKGLTTEEFGDQVRAQQEKKVKLMQDFSKRVNPE